MPMRRCTVCRVELRQERLIRLVSFDGKGITVDLRGKLPGRGAYACAETRCLSGALKGAASRSLRQSVRATEPENRLKEVEEGLLRLVREGLSLSARRQGLTIGLKETLQDGSAGPVVAAKDCSERTRKMVDQSERDVYVLGTQEELGHWSGRGPTGVLGLSEGPAAHRLINNLARLCSLRASQVA
ncbi:MAG TPA: hypothetical protein DEB46_06325 [Myxococcales bacterium]|nr:hypothetical protein [Myxococcales bacterium]HBU47909.1 hypothetical protein [Myxococcales bacterium]